MGIPSVESLQSAIQGGKQQKGRGLAIYSTNELMNIRAKGKDGKDYSVQVDIGWASIDPLTALTIYQRCVYVFGVISGRANRMSSLEWHVVPIKKDEDRIAVELRNAKERFEEADAGDYQALGQRIALFKEMRNHLWDLKPDMSNFDPAMRRWSRKIRSERADECNKIEEFFNWPAPGVTWPDFCKMVTQDLLVHGRAAIFKKQDYKGGVGNLYLLPGGTVVPLRGKYVGSVDGYAQISDGTLMYGMDEPQLFFRDELVFMSYLPNSATSYGLTPIDALINLVISQLLFSARMASFADGERMPEKAVVFGEKDPGLDPTVTGMDQPNDPIDPEEQRRVERKLNMAARNAAIATLTGVGTPLILDLSKADTMPTEIDWQREVKKFVGMAYNASNLELNETGGDGTSGRSTSEAQERQENAKEIRPMVRIFEESFSREIIPQKFGYGYQMRFSASRSDGDQVDLATRAAGGPVISVNEARQKYMDLDPLIEEGFDQPKDTNPAQQVADSFGALADSSR